MKEENKWAEGQLILDSKDPGDDKLYVWDSAARCDVIMLKNIYENMFPGLPSVTSSIGMVQRILS